MPNETRDERRRRQNRESQRRFRIRHRKEHPNFANSNDHLQVTALASSVSPQNSLDIVQTEFLGPISDNDTFATSTPHFPELWNDDRLLSLGSLLNTSYSITSTNAPIDGQPLSSTTEYAELATSVLGGHPLPSTSDHGNGPLHSCTHSAQPISIMPQNEGGTRTCFEPTCQRALLNPCTELGRSSETGSQGGTVDLHYPRQQLPPSMPSSASKKLQPSRSRGPRRRRVRKKVDSMIAEIQEVYRVGVFLGLFEKDEELQQLLGVVRERFRDLGIRHFRKGSSDESSNCYTSDDDDGAMV